MDVQWVSWYEVILLDHPSLSIVIIPVKILAVDEVMMVEKQGGELTNW
ncbi:hypothetical protein GF325_14535 [Candidatus Bathyarchaeota archaeon]|nr:hypothetical protein [Candidatus Bathyarchaeota archaeon]